MPAPDTPAPAPAPDTKKKIHRGPVNKAHVAEIKNARAVAASATDAKYASALAAVALDPALAPDAVALAGTIEQALGDIVGARAGRKSLTAGEAEKRDVLLALFHPIQAAAKRAPTVDAATLREIYGVGKPLTRAALDDVVGAGRAMLARLVPDKDGKIADTLPGVTADNGIKALGDALKAYTTANDAQGAQQATAEGALEDVTGAVARLAALRHAIQLAADQAFPPKTKGNATARKAFLLPPNRPLSV